MRKITNIKFATLLALAVVLLVGCTKEQSSLSMDDLKKSAKIMGQYTYDEGMDYVGGKYERLIKPAAGVTVEVTIPVGDVTGNDKDKGVVTYTTKTDKDGRYEMVIPMTDNGVEVTIKPVDFVGVYQSVVEINGGTPEYLHQEVVYSAESAKVALKPNQIKVNDGMYSHTIVSTEDGYPYVSKYIVNVGKATYSLQSNSVGDEVINKEYRPFRGADVEISVTYADNILKYIATTDSDGVAVFNIPTHDMNWSPNITVNVKSFVEDSFLYYRNEYNEVAQAYVNESYVIEGGVFEQASTISGTVAFSDLEGMPAPESRVKMNFKPFDGVETYGYSVSEWSSVQF